MHAARMQSTNVEFMGTKCLQRIWKRPSTACRRLGDGSIKVGGNEDERRGDRYISEESNWRDGYVRCGT